MSSLSSASRQLGLWLWRSNRRTGDATSLAIADEGVVVLTVANPFSRETRAAREGRDSHFSHTNLNERSPPRSRSRSLGAVRNEQRRLPR